MTIRRGAGTIVEMANAAGTVFTAIPSILSAAISKSRGEQEVTALDSTGKDYLNEFQEGTLTISVFFRPDQATHADISGLQAIMSSGEARLFRIRPNGTNRAERVQAFMTGDAITFNPNEPMQREFTLRCNMSTHTFETV